MFLLVTVGLSASAIASGIAQRETNVYDLSRVQAEIEYMAKQANSQLRFQESRVCDLIDCVEDDLWKVNAKTRWNRYSLFRFVNNDDGCADVRKRKHGH